MENNENVCYAIDNRERMKEEIMQYIERMDAERLKMLCITARIWAIEKE